MAFTVINLAKVQSLAGQASHTKHFALIEGLSLNVGAHNPLLGNDGGKNLNVSQWLVALRVMYNGYSIVGLRAEKTRLM